MNYQDEWFAPESVEEQIEQHLTAPDQLSENTRLLQDLQRLTADDAGRLARIRARLAEHLANDTERKPVPIRRYRYPQTQPLAPSLLLPQLPRQIPRRSRFLTNLLSGLVAVLIMGSMLAAFTLFRSQQQLADVPLKKLVSAPPIHGTAAFLMDVTSGKVIVDINSHARLPLFDTAEIMTAVVAIENANLDQSVVIEQGTLDELVPSTSTAYLQVGDQLQLRDLLYGLLFSSGNDAAVAIAHAVAGNTQKFVEMMNEEAHQLQLDGTHFTSPYNSVDLNNYSNAADLTRLGSYALQLSVFAQIVVQQNYALPATREHHSYLWHNMNSLLTAYTGMNGVQLNYGNVVFSARRNNHLLVGTELGVQPMNLLVSDVKMLLDRGFASIPPDPTPTPTLPSLGNIGSRKRG
ncbi:MAG TPA: hypothetical protein VFB60_18915 [Ktedonobacteraceae bacterium]|nr:hypothetical protein [Ktedonobacteraceae bacterium]